MKSARRRARELAIQGLYAWQMSGLPAADILAHLSDSKEYERADQTLLNRLLAGTITEADRLRDTLTPLLDRAWGGLSPVERAVLLLASFELSAMPEVPYKVVINEAVDLAKIFGGTDGHKYVNGVLDRVSRALRPAETA
jgi:N utilization substance protein B